MYLLLILLFISNFVVAFVLYNESKQIKEITSNQDYFSQIIKKDQRTNALAIKTYIACLLELKPSGNVPAQEQACFDNAPPVK